MLFAVALASGSGQGLAQQPKVEHFVDDFPGSFSPDGKTIVFERLFSTSRRGIDTHPVPQRSVLLLMRADGSRKRVLRHAGARFESDASFSPDGRSILFVRDKRIYIMRRDGSGARLVRSDSLRNDCPRFSRDATKISFWRGTTKGGAYFVMNADGTNVRRISDGQRTVWGCPSWFPGGRRLIFTNAHLINLQVASVDGTSKVPITDERDGWFYRPSVSPNGRLIVCDGFLERSGYGLILMRPDGSGMQRITTGGDIQNDAVASWSPEGRKIVFSGYRGFNGAGVYVVNPDGTGMRRLSNFRR